MFGALATLTLGDVIAGTLVLAFFASPVVLILVKFFQGIGEGRRR